MRRKSSRRKKENIDWAGFPSELLEIIANKLKNYIDYVRFRVVCIHWRSSISPKPQYLPAQLPWLLFPFNTDMKTDCSFLDLSTNKFHHLNLTESGGSRCCGSSLGWLVFVEEFTPKIYLLNPLTRDVIHLPPVTDFPNVLKFNRSKVDKEYLVKTLPDGKQFSKSMKDMRNLFIKKIVLSSSSGSLENDYIALVIFNDDGHIAFHKKGGGVHKHKHKKGVKKRVEKWSIIKEAGDYFYQDAIYYKGSFYAITTTGSMAICDLSGVSPIVTLVTPSSIPSDRVGYLANFLGELMLVTRKIDLFEREFGSADDYEYESIYETVDSSVFQYDSSDQMWVQMDTLGDHMLFLGGNYSVCLSASDFSGSSCDRNCIYFSSEIHQDSVHGIYDCVVHRLDDDLVEPLPCANISSRHISHPCIWVTPNPC